MHGKGVNIWDKLFIKIIIAQKKIKDYFERHNFMPKLIFIIRKYFNFFEIKPLHIFYGFIYFPGLKMQISIFLVSINMISYFYKV